MLGSTAAEVLASLKQGDTSKDPEENIKAKEQADTALKNILANLKSLKPLFIPDILHVHAGLKEHRKKRRKTFVNSTHLKLTRYILSMLKDSADTYHVRPKQIAHNDLARRIAIFSHLQQNYKDLINDIELLLEDESSDSDLSEEEKQAAAHLKQDYLFQAEPKPRKEDSLSEIEKLDAELEKCKKLAFEEIEALFKDSYNTLKDLPEDFPDRRDYEDTHKDLLFLRDQMIYTSPNLESLRSQDRSKTPNQEEVGSVLFDLLVTLKKIEALFLDEIANTSQEEISLYHEIVDKIENLLPGVSVEELADKISLENLNILNSYDVEEKFVADYKFLKHLPEKFPNREAYTWITENLLKLRDYRRATENRLHETASPEYDDTSSEISI